MTRTHVGVAALLSLVVGWFVFDAVSSLVGLPAYYALLGVDPANVPWVALWAGVIVPVVFYAVAVIVARRLSLTRFTLVLIVALAATATVRLSLIALATGSITLF
ncbi:MAG: hypothetical protein C0444_00990 [Microbacterium sp.]|nr:hypothetical protein [Microbacterium sp.]MBA4346027.1 hypothetical protein [Microbacterium sp.]